MLFFQAMLLAGYAYAHWLGSLKSLKLQALIHVPLLAISLAFLPIGPSAEHWKIVVNGDPTWRILLMLAASVGGPYLLLSATSPLIQRWFHLAKSNDSPWTLYALSNLGSFLALLSYPFIVEPLLRLRAQTVLWSALYVLFALCCAATAWSVRNTKTATTPVDLADFSSPRWPEILLWLGLATCGSLLLLGATNQITHDIAAIPFLWVAPLSIYLLTFIIAFAGDRWYPRGTMTALAGIAAPAACVASVLSITIPVWAQLAVQLAALFVMCMVCHGELALARPSPRYLTAFYLTISAGGALGGGLAALVAPRVFSDFREYTIGLLAACVLVFVAWIRDGAWSEWQQNNLLVRVPLMVLSFGVFTSAYAVYVTAPAGLDHRRNFYGVLRVADRADANGPYRQLTHGSISHGIQYTEEAKRRLPTTYYGPHSGVALALDAVPSPRRVALIGLGAGTLAAWGRTGDTLRFYEINPLVDELAKKWFTFLADSRAQTEVVLGDARVQMEQELAAGQRNDFDLIAVDAFSGDAIPTHLLTREAADIYRQRLKPGGFLALHISNRSLNLEPVTRGMARHLGWTARMVLTVPEIFDPGPDGAANPNGESTSRWVVMSDSRDALAKSKVRDTLLGWSGPKEAVIEWSDDFTSLWGVLKLR